MVTWVPGDLTSCNPEGLLQCLLHQLLLTERNLELKDLNQNLSEKDQKCCNQSWTWSGLPTGCWCG